MASVLVPLAQRCEELEAVTIIDLLRRANITVVSASLDGQPVIASRGVTVIADTSLDDALKQDYDMVVLPGGLPGADYLNEDQRVLELLKKMAYAGKYVAAICAAPKVLATAGLLSGKTATSYPGTLEKLNIPDIKLDSSPVVIDGNIITSRGPGTSIDFALTLIETLVGKEIKDNVEAGLVRS